MFASGLGLVAMVMHVSAQWGGMIRMAGHSHINND